MTDSDVHPLAWWVWALGAGMAVSVTTNALLIATVLAAVAFVVAGGEPRGFRGYLVLGLTVVAVRVVGRMLFGVDTGGEALFTLPQWRPFGTSGLRIGGPVTAVALRSAATDGFRLGALIVCLGAANSVADPKRLLRSVPSVWGRAATALTVAMNVAPQMVESARRIRRAHRLRGRQPSRRHLLRDLATPVMVDAVDRSLALAASMECRGFGRRSDPDPTARALGLAGVMAGSVALLLGTYQALSATGTGRQVGLVVQGVGATVAVAGTVVAAQRSAASRYRPERFGPLAVGVGGAGVTAAVVAAWLVPAAVAHPVSWPVLDPISLVVPLVVAGPGFVAK